MPDITVCLLNKKDMGGQWALVSTEEEKIDFNSFRSDLLPIIKGKGGGKAPLWQGEIGDCSLLKEFGEKFSAHFA